MSADSFAVGQRVTTGDGTGKGVEGVIHAVHGPYTYSVRIGSKIVTRTGGYISPIKAPPQAFAIGQTVEFKHYGDLRTGYIRRVTGTNLYEIQLPSGARFLRPAEDLRPVSESKPPDSMQETGGAFSERNRSLIAQLKDNIDGVPIRRHPDPREQGSCEAFGGKPVVHPRFHFVIDIKREGEGLKRQVRATCGEFANVSNDGERAMVAKLMTLDAVAEVPAHAAHKLLLEAGLDHVLLCNPENVVALPFRALQKRALFASALHAVAEGIHYRLTVELPT